MPANRLPQHTFTLPPEARAASVVHLGDDAARAALFAKLRNGQPITVTVLGASVAENGGCLTQPSRRCMARSGVANALTEPRGQPVKGFLVRWFEHLNRTWPCTPTPRPPQCRA
eukprot:540643-Prymnesium_polylepis.2